MSPAPSIDVSLLGSFNQTTANDTNNDVSFSDSSAMILSEARATFARMEKESEVRERGEEGRGKGGREKIRLSLSMICSNYCIYITMHFIIFI